MKTSHRIWGLIALVAASAITIVVALEYNWFPTLISQRDGKIDTLYKALLIASIPFFIIIVAGVLFMAFEFRAKGEDDERDGEPIHGNTRLEIVWTLVPTMILIGLGIYAWWVLDYTEAKQKGEKTINVYGQQFEWTFVYPKGQFGNSSDVSANILEVPLGQPLAFRLTSRDVIHSFFVPNARIKKDLTDGFVKTVRFTPDKLGDYPIICAELCGFGHSTMRSTLRVVRPAVFQAWIRGGGKVTPTGGTPVGAGAAPAAGTANLKTAGSQLFSSNGCGGCHTLAAAGAAGKVGPDLDTVAVGKQGAAAVRESIVDPDKVITKGFKPNIMPPNFGTTLSKQDINTLVQYLVKYAQK